MNGKCCEDIGLSVAPLALEIAYRHFLSGQFEQLTTLFMSETPDRVPLYWDIHLIYPMLEFLKQDYRHPDGNKEVDYPVFHYRCRHHCQKTGLCLIQNIKPRMCLSFPEKVCNYEGCSCPGDKRNLKQEKKEIQQDFIELLQKKEKAKGKKK